ncbi:hypothetical protein [Streptomyces iconiensis]|uniref:Uncharacterized protein n=1 Tax=Streptomyces iconiensis TaxID=1384038 RepID=A0ABT6ZRW0_9ACTN|nr:hypothetical protein [Streptomyces iconiensis]MDJ1131774.1 hypothetical protein [Streptomyces iconiensis]
MTDSSGTGRTDEAPRHPGIRFKIYTVNSRTLERGPAVAFTEPPGAPMSSSVYPPCECPRCPDPYRAFGGRHVS